MQYPVNRIKSIAKNYKHEKMETKRRKNFLVRNQKACFLLGRRREKKLTKNKKKKKKKSIYVIHYYYYCTAATSCCCISIVWRFFSPLYLGE